jgi:hypothetical protein
MSAQPAAGHADMRTLATSIAISVSGQRAWQVMADVERWPQWTPSVRRVERLDVEPLGVGSRVRIEQPKLRPAVWTVTVWSPEEVFAWVTRSPGVSIHGEHRIEARGDGCVVTLSVRFDGFLGAIVGRMARKLTNEYIALEAAGLKKECEGIK